MPSLLRCCLCALFLVAFSARADAGGEALVQRAREVSARNLDGLQTTFRLTVTARDGSTRAQTLSTAARRFDGKLKSLTRFLAPAAVAGIALLSVEGDVGAAPTLSLWLPKLRRVRKVAPAERGKDFMDTDFTFSDLGAAQLAQGAATQAGEEPVLGRSAWVLEGPGEGPVGKIRVWLDKQTLLPLQAEYQDREGRPYKRYRASSLATRAERTLVDDAVMENLQTGSRPRVQLVDVQRAPDGEDAYSDRALERG